MENYILENSDIYYDSSVLIKCIEERYDQEFANVRKFVNCLELAVTENLIEGFLNEMLLFENPDLKKRIDSPKKVRSNKNSELSDEDVKIAAQEFADSISIKRYKLDPNTLFYFSNYISILKDKINKLLNIIESIGNKNIENIKDILEDLDIILDQKGNILGTDVSRLLDATFYNINELCEMLGKANDLYTYLDFKLPSSGNYLDGVYPSKDLQVKNGHASYYKGNVALSERQEEQLKNEERQFVKVAKRIFGDLDN